MLQGKLIRVNFDLMHEIGLVVGGDCYFEGGHTFIRLQYKIIMRSWEGLVSFT